MIAAAHYCPALRALQKLIIQAKALAYENNGDRVAELLNDVEMLPEYLADDSDRTDEFVEMMRGIGRIHPGCRYIIDEFERHLA
jgi:hypothetical protein